MMPCRRLLGSIDSAWDTVVISAAPNGWSRFHEFIDGDESKGFYACVSRVSRVNPQTTDWHFSFSDPRTAFAFKMKFR